MRWGDFEQACPPIATIARERFADDQLKSKPSFAKENIDKAMDRWLQRQKIHSWERQLVTDIASLDGSIVIDRNGNLVSYGQVLKIAGVSAGGAQVARTPAAIAGSKYGLALKVSADGDISFYSGGEKRFEI